MGPFFKIAETFAGFKSFGTTPSSRDFLKIILSKKQVVSDVLRNKSETRPSIPGALLLLNIGYFPTTTSGVVTIFVKLELRSLLNTCSTSGKFSLRSSLVKSEPK